MGGKTGMSKATTTTADNDRLAPALFGGVDYQHALGVLPHAPAVPAERLPCRKRAGRVSVIPSTGLAHARVCVAHVYNGGKD